jgi:hypothetical protein
LGRKIIYPKELNTMHSFEVLKLDKPNVQMFSAVDDGFHVEICDANNEVIVTIREDEKNGKMFVMHRHNNDIEIPLMKLTEIILMAEREVHKESFYDEHPAQQGEKPSC